MTTSLTAHFDGKVLVPEKPVRLPVGKRLRLIVEVAEQVAVAAQRKNRKIIGQDEFTSGIRDLGSNKRHLREFGK